MIRSFPCVVLLSVLLPAEVVAGQVEAVSVTPFSATAKGYLAWESSAVSNDGRWIVFESDATDLVPGQVDQGSTNDVFLRDRATGTTILVSRSIDGAHVAASGATARISADGSVVAFFSAAGNLVPGQPNPGNYLRLHLFERSTGKIQIVTPPNASVDRLNEGCDLSADGRWLVYNMAPSQTAFEPQHIYLFDRFTGQSTLVDRSAVSPGQPSNGSSRGPRISADGRYVAFPSSSTNIIDGPGGAFLYDRIANQMIRVTDTPAREPRISADGRWLAFLSEETDLIPGQVDNNGSYFDIFLWDRVTGSLTLVSHSAASPLATGTAVSSWSSDLPGYEMSFAESVISADGRWIAFISTSDNLGERQFLFHEPEAYLFDRTDGTVVRVSRGDIDFISGLALSDDGSRVAYASESLHEVPGQVDSRGTQDVFVFDRVLGTRQIASRSMSSATTAVGTLAGAPRLSGDGRVVVFGSSSQDLVANDLTGDNVFAYVIPDPGQDFYTVIPCRILDTRQAGPVLFSDVPRQVTATGSCGIPATARALAVNVTVLQSSGAGRLVVQPGDVSSETSSVNFAAGETRASHATLGLAFDGSGTLSLTPHIPGGGTVHVILDVSGYYE